MAILFCGNQLIGGMEMQPQHERREHSSVAFLLALSGDARLHTPTGEWTMGANDLLIVSDLRSVVLHEASADWCVEYVAAPVDFWESLPLRLESPTTAGKVVPSSDGPTLFSQDGLARTPEEDARAARDLLAGWGCNECELLRLSNVETNRLYDVCCASANAAAKRRPHTKMTCSPPSVACWSTIFSRSVPPSSPPPIAVHVLSSDSTICSRVVSPAENVKCATMLHASG